MFGVRILRLDCNESCVANKQQLRKNQYAMLLKMKMKMKMLLRYDDLVIKMWDVIYDDVYKRLKIMAGR